MKKKKVVFKKDFFQKVECIWLNMTFVAINSGAQECMTKRSQHSHILKAKTHKDLLVTKQ